MKTCSHINVLLIIMAVILTACASAAPTVYRQDYLRAVNIWYIDFAYETGRLEQKVENSGSTELKKVFEGHSATELQLMNDIFFRLQDEHGIKVTNNISESTGDIRLHPVRFLSGGFKSLDIKLTTPNGEIIARIRITNGDRPITFIEDDEFATYSADAIADLINNSK